MKLRILKDREGYTIWDDKQHRLVTCYEQKSAEDIVVILNQDRIKHMIAVNDQIENLLKHKRRPKDL